MTRTTRHPQVEIPELGISVDEGLEDLIRGCWRHGIETMVSCIGDDEDDPGFIGFVWEESALRWEQLTGVAIEWMPDEVASVAETYFDRSDVQGLVEKLNGVS